MGVKVNPNQVSHENLLNHPVQPGKVDKAQVPGSGSQPAAPQAPKTLDLSGFNKFQTGGRKIGGVFGHRPVSSSINVSGVKDTASGHFDRLAEYGLGENLQVPTPLLQHLYNSETV